MVPLLRTWANLDSLEPGSGTASSIEYIRAGRLRALAVTTATRWDALPDIPTVGEFVPGCEASTWFGVGAPKATPAKIVEKLNKEINAGLADPKIKARLADDLGGAVLALSPADFGKLIAEETDKWGKVIRAANIKAEVIAGHSVTFRSAPTSCCAAPSFLAASPEGVICVDLTVPVLCPVLFGSLPN
jgi:Tripartite tricarboxylate transporter family receptor